jgi:hypothetical protein
VVGSLVWERREKAITLTLGNEYLYDRAAKVNKFEPQAL